MKLLTRIGARASRKSIVKLDSSVNHTFSICPKVENREYNESKENDGGRGTIIDLLEPPCRSILTSSIAS